MTLSARPAAVADDPVIHESDLLWERTLGLIPAGTQTLAKGPGQHVRGVSPKYLRRGRGARVEDVDGNEYLDLTMGVGPLVLGYGHPEVDAAIRRQLEDGITFSLMHPLEVEVAEAVRRLVPCAEMVRFSKTGADVTSAAVRLARAFTGRRKVLCCGYHGWHDWYVATTDRAQGVPEEVASLSWTIPYNDLAGVAESIDDDTACVILEPTVFEAPKPGFLEGLRTLCTERRVLLVFDEMWTGFRLALGGAQEHFGVTPDLATFSKAIANGMPLSVLAGRADVMSLLEREVFFFTTFGGEALSLAAAQATMRVLEREGVPGWLAARGRQVREGYEEIASRLGISSWTRCVGMDARTMVTFDASAGNPLELKSLLSQELVRRGVLWQGFHNLALAHGEDEVAWLLAAYEEALPVLKEAVETDSVRPRIAGEPMEPVFRKTSGFNGKPRS
ncbi:MAG: aminotransferase class III-fold pyridoxal phosphate-dependent enzyme [Thermoanaerobaculia bacterium]